MDIVKSLSAERDIHEDIIVYAVDIHVLDIANIKYNYNYRCELYDDIRSFAYTKAVVSSQLLFIDEKNYDKYL